MQVCRERILSENRLDRKRKRPKKPTGKRRKASRENRARKLEKAPK